MQPSRSTPCWSGCDKHRWATPHTVQHSLPRLHVQAMAGCKACTLMQADQEGMPHLLGQLPSHLRSLEGCSDGTSPRHEEEEHFLSSSSSSDDEQAPTRGAATLADRRASGQQAGTSGRQHAPAPLCSTSSSKRKRQGREGSALVTRRPPGEGRAGMRAEQAMPNEGIQDDAGMEAAGGDGEWDEPAGTGGAGAACEVEEATAEVEAAPQPPLQEKTVGMRGLTQQGRRAKAAGQQEKGGQSAAAIRQQQSQGESSLAGVAGGAGNKGHSTLQKARAPGKGSAAARTAEPAVGKGGAARKRGRPEPAPEEPSPARTLAEDERSAAAAQILRGLGGAPRRFAFQAAAAVPQPPAAAQAAASKPQPAKQQPAKAKARPRRATKPAAAPTVAQPRSTAAAGEEHAAAAEPAGDEGEAPAPSVDAAAAEGLCESAPQMEGGESDVDALATEVGAAAVDGEAGAAEGTAAAADASLCVLLNPNNPRYDPAFALEYAQVR